MRKSMTTLRQLRPCDRFPISSPPPYLHIIIFHAAQVRHKNRTVSTNSWIVSCPMRPGFLYRFISCVSSLCYTCIGLHDSFVSSRLLHHSRAFLRCSRITQYCTAVSCLLVIKLSTSILVCSPLCMCSMKSHIHDNGI